MKRAKSLVEQRQKDILTVLEKNKHMTPSKLAKIVGVSTVTIHRDLTRLEEIGKVETFYGGVRLANAFTEKLTEDDVCREEIARLAATFVEDDDIIFVNTSSTALAMLSYITASGVTIVTNNGNAIKKQYGPNLCIILTGGEIRRPKESMVGDYAAKNIMSINANKCFIGCSGLTTENGMTTANNNEVNLNAMMMERTSGERYILANHKKLGKDSAYTCIDIGKISNIITDTLCSEDVLDSFRQLNIRIYTAGI